MSTNATNQVNSPAVTVGARSAAYPTTWQPCLNAASAIKATRVRMHGNGFLTTRRLKERSSP
jgi:hypothetical protein